LEQLEPLEPLEIGGLEEDVAADGWDAKISQKSDLRFFPIVN